MQVRSRVYHYTTGLQWIEQRRGVCTADGKPDIATATPPEFKGHAGMWSPEDFYVASANTCLMSTFVGMASRANLAFKSYTSQAEGTLESVDGNLAFTRIVLSPHVIVSHGEDVERARELLAKAKDDCLVARSMKTEVVLGDVEVRSDGVEDVISASPSRVAGQANASNGGEG